MTKERNEALNAVQKVRKKQGKISIELQNNFLFSCYFGGCSLRCCCRLYLFLPRIRIQSHGISICCRGHLWHRNLSY